MQALKPTINKWDPVKLGSFCKAKDIVNRTKWQPTEWENENHNFKKQTNKQTNKQGAVLNREFSTGESQTAKKHLHVQHPWLSGKCRSKLL